MRAYVLEDADSPPRLREMPKPSPKDTELLIRVLSCAVNPVDDLVSGGFFLGVDEYRYPAIFGRDLCGVVEEVGPGVSRFAVGDTVWGYIKRDYIGDGTFAEYVTCDESRSVAIKPSQLSAIDAGSLAQSAVTALECLDALALTAGDTVLVNGATGGVGGFAVQIAAARKLHVIATARPGAATEYVRSLGADEVYDWSTGDLADAVRTRHPDGIAGVVDFVRHNFATVIGSDESKAHEIVSAFTSKVLAPDGRFASTTNGASDEAIADGVGFNIHSEPTPSNLQALNELVDRGLLRGCVSAVFAFDRIAEAFERQRSDGRGKTAVVIDPELWATVDPEASAER